jgi:hypothetical protein
MNIHAVIDQDVRAIRAALETPEMRCMLPILRAHKIEIERRMTVAEFDAKLKGSNLSTQQRIALKGAMTRAGLLV